MQSRSLTVAARQQADKMRYTSLVTRRLYVPRLHLGSVQLPDAEAHHARDVLRIEQMTTVELFDDDGKTGSGKLRFDGQHGASVAVEEIAAAVAHRLHLTIASAVPKGERADWMVEKLSELGVARFIPLATMRSVVLPGGTNKKQRWERLAIESAKQSRRAGVMRIDDLTPLALAIASGWYLSTQDGAVNIGQMLQRNRAIDLRLFIGPEGGWTEAECAAFDAAGLTAVRLTDTILRVETAAVAAAAVVMSAVQSHA